jgi:RNA polymerase sigma-70 factor, ECF subfamily
VMPGSGACSGTTSSLSGRVSRRSKRPTGGVHRASAGSAGVTGVMGAEEFQQVMAVAAQGDGDAFAALWHAHQPALLRYLQVAAPVAAEDLASEVWLVVARRLGRFGGDERGFRAWLIEIGRRQAKDWRRRHARHPVLLLPPDLLPDQPAAADPETTALEGFSTQAALGLIATLPPDQAEVITLRTVVGLDNGQVAAVLGNRPGAVRVLAHRGLRRLAQQLASSPSAREV